MLCFCVTIFAVDKSDSIFLYLLSNGNRKIKKRFHDQWKNIFGLLKRKLRKTLTSFWFLSAVSTNYFLMKTSFWRQTREKLGTVNWRNKFFCSPNHSFDVYQQKSTVLEQYRNTTKFWSKVFARFLRNKFSVFSSFYATFQQKAKKCSCPSQGLLNPPLLSVDHAVMMILFHKKQHGKTNVTLLCVFTPNHWFQYFSLKTESSENCIFKVEIRFWWSFSICTNIFQASQGFLGTPSNS